MKILIVEDSQFQQKMYDLIVRTRLARDVELLRAQDGAAALQTLGANTEIDLIVLDINMPRMNGEEFLQKASQLDFADRPPAVIVVSSTKLEERQDIPWEGPLSHLLKPFEPDEFCTKVRDLLTTASAGSSLNANP